MEITSTTNTSPYEYSPFGTENSGANDAGAAAAKAGFGVQGDTVSLSGRSLPQAEEPTPTPTPTAAPNASATFSSKGVSGATLGGESVTYTVGKKSSTLGWGGANIDLSAFSSDKNLQFQKKDGGGYLVKDGDSLYELDSSGKAVVDADGKLKASEGTWKNDAATLALTRGDFTSAGSGESMIINEKGGTINGSSGSDTIFNFNAAAKIDGKGGSDTVYSNGLSGSITVGGTGASSHIKVTGAVSGNITAGGDGTNTVDLTGASSISSDTITLGSGTNVLDAGTKAITAKNITDQGGSTTIKGGSMTGTAVDLKGNKTTPTTNKVEITGAIKGGSISTGLSVGTISAASLADTKIDMDKSGSDIGTSVQTVTVKGNVSGTSITTGAGADKIEIGGNWKGAEGSKIDLGDGNDIIDIKGTVTNGAFDMGKGDDKFDAGKAVKDVTYTGADGKDDITIKGAVSNSTFNLGSGDNSFTAKNAKDKAQSLTNVSISASDVKNDSGAITAAGSTTIEAGAYKATKAGISIDLGSGGNSLTLASVTGFAKATPSEETTIKFGAGNDTVNLGGSAKNVTFDLGAGVNELTAKNAKDKVQALTNVNIYARDVLGDDGKVSVAGSAKIEAGNYKATKSGISIDLGSAKDGSGDGNRIILGSISGFKKKADADVATQINMGVNGVGNQTLTAKGASNVNLQTGVGDDDITFNGKVSNATLDLGAGANALDVIKEDKEGTMVGQYGLTNVTIKAQDTFKDDGTIDVLGSLTMKGGAYKDSVGGNQIVAGSGASDIALSSITGYKMKEADTPDKQTSILLGNANKKKDDKQTWFADQKLATITGGASNIFVETGLGNDTVSFNGAVKDSTFHLGGTSMVGGADSTVAGQNEFSAYNTKKNKAQALTNVNITSIDYDNDRVGSTKVTAGAYKATKAGMGITLGSGKNEVNLASFTGFVDKTNESNPQKTTLAMGGTGTKEQTLNISGAVKNMTHIGGNGNDSITVNGAITDSSFDLGAGTNYLGAWKADKNGDKAGQAMNGVSIKAASTGDSQLTTIETSGMNASKTATSAYELGEKHKLNIGKNLGKAPVKPETPTPTPTPAP